MGSPTCPTCKGPLREVRNTSAYLNDDQASSQRAGDFYCEKCPPNGRSNANRWCYWWAREVTTPSAPADDARPMVTGGGLIKFDRRADDASGAEAMAPGCHEHVALWDAINAYSVACGGHPTRGGGARMDAVARVEKALRAALRREKGGDK